MCRYNFHMQSKNERIYKLGCLMKQENHKSYIQCVQFISLNLYSDSNSVDSGVCSTEICRKGVINVEINVVNGITMQKINTND